MLEAGRDRQQGASGQPERGPAKATREPSVRTGECQRGRDIGSDRHRHLHHEDECAEDDERHDEPLERRGHDEQPNAELIELLSFGMKRDTGFALIANSMHCFCTRRRAASLYCTCTSICRR